jgi:monofunctional biosynthetic peptidoglycan transglycosylase
LKPELVNSSRLSLKKVLLRIFKFSVVLFFTISIGISLLFTWVNPHYTWLMVIKRHTPEAKGGTSRFRQQWVSIDEISPVMVLAVIAAEDNKFMKHNGFDWESIKKARKYNQQGKKLRGASTISQQTAKNVFLWPKRSWVRKGLEAYFTLLIETFWTKERIMEVYLNIAEMGKGIYGAEAAAREYYGKPASRLTRHEAAMIATTLPAPSKRNPARPSSYMVSYQRKILWNMNNLGKIDLKEKEQKSTR